MGATRNRADPAKVSKCFLVVLQALLEVHCRGLLLMAMHKSKWRAVSNGQPRTATRTDQRPRAKDRGSKPKGQTSRTKPLKPKHQRPSPKDQRDQRDQGPKTEDQRQRTNAQGKSYRIVPYRIVGFPKLPLVEN